MKTQGAKRGRPRGASRYADEDRAPLERMYVLCKQGKPVSAAAKAVAKEMKLRPSPDQAAERLRKKFRQFREEKKASPSKRPEPRSGKIPLVEIAKRVRQAHELRRTPGGKAVKEQVRWVRKNRDLIREAAEHARRIRKLKI